MNVENNGQGLDVRVWRFECRVYILQQILFLNAGTFPSCSQSDKQ